MEEIRTCNNCGFTDLLVKFPKDGKDKNNNQKYSGSCSQCRSLFNKKCKQQIKEKNKNIPNIYDVVKEKYCGGCKIIKPSVEFSKDVMNSDGLDSQCKECKNKYKHSLYNKIKNELQTGVRKFIEITEKKCSLCQIIKPVEEIVKLSSSIDRYSYTCKSCAIIIDKKQRSKQRILLETNQMVYKEVQEKVCSVCGINKTINEYSTDKWSYDNHLSQCKTCVNERYDIELSKEYYQANKVRILEGIRISGIKKRKQCLQEIIKKSGDKNRNTILYILKFKGHGLEYIKIGITRLSIHERYKCGYDDFEYDILYENYYEYKEARALEQLLLQEHWEYNLGYEYPLEFRSRFPGWTECVIGLHKIILENYNIEIDYNRLNELNLLHN